MTDAPLASPELQNPLIQFIAKYKNDRVAFVREVLAVQKIEPWQEKVLRLLDAGETRISIRSGHGVGKTTLLAWVCEHFLFTRYPAKIAVTAPSATQLFDALAAETKMWLKKAEATVPAFTGLFEATSDRVFLKAQPEAVFLTYRTSRKESPEALQGIHADNVLLIADEASGVPEAVFEAAAGSMSTEGSITILAGNPTRATGFFHATHTKLRHIWKSIKVACFESSRVSTSYIEEERAFGENSNRWRIRVLGEFPEGDDDTLIARSLIEGAVERKVTAARNDPTFWGLDVARFGSDASALAKRKGAVMLEKVKKWRGLDTMALCGQIVNAWNETPERERPEAIFVDVIGLGAGVVDRLAELNLPAVGINVSESPSFSLTQAMRLRDELWCLCRDWFKTLKVSIPDDPETIEELAQPRVAFTSSGKTKVESKDEMRSRGVGSPDGGDAFVLTFARQGAIGAGAMAGDRSKKGPLKRRSSRRV
jgi:phage terminase large subunit